MAQDNSIRIVKNPTIYTIEVNDKGETITIDFSDIDQIGRFNIALGELEKVSKNIAGLSKDTSDNQESENIAEIQSSTTALIGQLSKGYELIDLMFGEGSVEKIFGGHKTIDGFFQFFEQIAPHIEKARGMVEKMSKELANKYEVKEEENAEVLK